MKQRKRSRVGGVKSDDVGFINSGNTEPVKWTRYYKISNIFGAIAAIHFILSYELFSKLVNKGSMWLAI